MLEHDSSCQVSIDNGSTDNIHVLIVQYGLRVEIKESQKKRFSSNTLNIVVRFAVPHSDYYEASVYDIFVFLVVTRHRLVCYQRF